MGNVGHKLLTGFIQLLLLGDIMEYGKNTGKFVILISIRAKKCI